MFLIVSFLQMKGNIIISLLFICAIQLSADNLEFGRTNNFNSD